MDDETQVLLHARYEDAEKTLTRRLEELHQKLSREEAKTYEWRQKYSAVQEQNSILESDYQNSQFQLRKFHQQVQILEAHESGELARARAQIAGLQEQVEMHKTSAETLSEEVQRLQGQSVEVLDETSGMRAQQLEELETECLQLGKALDRASQQLEEQRVIELVNMSLKEDKADLLERVQFLKRLEVENAQIQSKLNVAEMERKDWAVYLQSSKYESPWQLTRELASARAEIEALKSVVKGRDDLIKVLRDQVSEKDALKAEITALNNEIDEKDAEIYTLQSNADTQTLKVKLLQKQIAGDKFEQIQQLFSESSKRPQRPFTPTERPVKKSRSENVNVDELMSLQNTLKETQSQLKMAQLDLSRLRTQHTAPAQPQATPVASVDQSELIRALEKENEQLKEGKNMVPLSAIGIMESKIENLRKSFEQQLAARDHTIAELRKLT